MYPAALAAQVKKSWRRSFHRREEIVPLPERKTLTTLLDVAFQSSLTYDEGRPTRFQVIYCNEDSFVEDDPHGYWNHKRKPIVFEKDLPFDSAHVRRLAPATDPSQTLIGVKNVTSNGQDVLRIWGLLDIGSAWFKLMRHERDFAGTPPEAFMVTSNEPGHLSVSHGGDVVATLRAGEIILPSSNILYSGPIGRFLDSARNSCYAAASARISRDRFSDDGDDWPRRYYTIILERILLELEAQGHGGTLLLIPHEWKDGSHPWNSVVSAKYRMKDDRIWKVLIDELEFHHSYFETYFKIWEAEEGVSAAEFKDLQSLSDKKDYAKEAMSDVIKFAASLAGVDGAIVMTDRFEIIGFGAEVTATAPVLRTVLSCDNAEGTEVNSLSVESFGTRHRAAFRFSWCLPQVVAFVASEDGGVRAVRRVGDSVMTWPEVTSSWT
ncbi:putative sensor domain DACNV-containing protein [Lentzea sp. NPDC034063]|uniref:putative sensor domain DACNV-containing protein n=1 Tax=unclassified Lentzea TaxID=2643253 RepID=UPI0033F07420